MPRDIGNEVIVAIIVVGVLAFALTFGIILSLSNTNNLNNANTTQISVAATSTPVEETPTNTETDEPTATAALTLTRTGTPTLTPSPRPTDTPHPTDTLTLTSTSTATLTATATITPSATRTATLTATWTVSPSATQTPTSTPTSAPTQTPTLTTTPTMTSTVSVCIAPFGWVVYETRAGDTLISIATAVGLSVDELRAANCLGSTVSLEAGTRLYVPNLPPGSSSGSLPGPGQALAAEGCTNPGTVIISPVPGEHVRGIVVVRGTAATPNFAYYRIELRPDGADVYNFYARAERPVTNDVLGSIDTRIWAAGLYWIRVSVIDDSGNVGATPCTIPVFFD